MHLTDQFNVIQARFPSIYQKLNKYGLNTENKDITVELSKSGDPTLVALYEGSPIYIHSKYNPVEEAKRIISQYSNLRDEHVVFFGVGLGYHIDYFMDQFPTAAFSVFEPSVDLFHQSIVSRRQNYLSSTNLYQLEVGADQIETHYFLNELLQKFDNGLILISLSSYEKIFQKSTSQFTEQFSQLIQAKKNNLLANVAFEQRWTINSVANFLHIIKSPNIFHDIKREHFCNKPALIVAAGPSLNDEIENLRIIKERGLAYIFAVGSAINTLLHHDIYPDAACSYDPQAITQITFRELRNRKIDTIPLLYGSSVGYETVATYPGPKVHMISDQDTIAAALLERNDEQEINVVHDAPSISVITFQLLSKLECNPIILVGQNLAFRDDQRYASGIGYMKQQVQEKDKKNSLSVEDVYGNLILTNTGFDYMRKALEEYISISNQEVINTTRGGAIINGAPFVSLGKLIEERLTQQDIVEDWEINHFETSYNMQVIKKKLEEINDSYELFKSIFHDFAKLLERLKRYTDQRQLSKVNTMLIKVDHSFYHILNNSFYRILLVPMNRVRIEWTLNQIKKIRLESELIIKADKIYLEFAGFFNKTINDLGQLAPHYERMYQDVIGYIEDINTKIK